MPNHRLQLLIEERGLPLIKSAQQRIVLARPVNVPLPNVIWQSIDPSSRTEVVREEAYGLCASSIAVRSGASIVKVAETGIPALDGAYYSFTPATVFNGRSPAASAAVATRWSATSATRNIRCSRSA